MKKSLSLLLAILMTISTFYGVPVSVLAADTDAPTEGTCGENAEWEYNPLTKTLDIGGTGAMTDYTSGTAPWYAFKDEVTTVNIDEGIETVGSYSFCQFSVLASVSLPDTLTNIGEKAFCDCEKINEIVIPDFVTIIGPYAFYNCSSATELTIGKSVTNISTCAFGLCKSLESVYIPESIEKIHFDSFNLCTHVKEFIVDSNNRTFSSVNGALLNDKDKVLIQYPLNSDEKSFTIPDGIITISEGAFYKCNKLESISLPSTIETIGGSAFYGCTGLTGITLPESLTNIGTSAFDNCSGIKTLVIPNSVKTIDAWAFEKCTGLTNVVFGKGLKSVGAYAFGYCSNLSNIKVLNCKTVFDYLAFERAKTNVNVEIYLESIDDMLNNNANRYLAYGPRKLILNGKEITKIVIPDGTTEIGDYALSSCSGLTSVTIPESVTSIGKAAFSGCSGLTNITIPDSVTSIGNYAFSGCSGLTNITIPDSVTSIGDSAFYGCSGLTNITIPDSVTSIGNYTFSHCSSLTSVNIPDNIASIGDGTFNECAVLKDFTISNSITSIGMNAFCGCKSLTSITIPDSVTYLGDFAFQNCEGLTSIHIGSGLTALNNRVFDRVSLNELVIPETVESITYSAFDRCTFTKITFLNKNCLIPNGTVPNSATIYGYPNSTAEEYAKNNNRNFVPLCTDGTTTHNFKRGEPFCLNDGCGAENPDYIAEYNGTCGNGVRWVYDQNEYTLTIFGEGEMDGSQPWSAFLPYIKTVVVENGITVIGESSFKNCNNLRSVSIANSVTSIGANAFEGCRWLRSLTVPSSIKTLGDNTFKDCERLTLIEYTGTKSQWNSFSKTALESDIIKNAVISCTDGEIYDNSKYYVEENAIYSADRNKLIKIIDSKAETEFDIPDGVKTVAEGTFENTGTEIVNFSDSVNTIEKDALTSDTIRVVNLSDNISSIDKEAIKPEIDAVVFKGYNAKDNDLDIVNENDTVTYKKLVEIGHKNITSLEIVPESESSSGNSVNLKTLNSSKRKNATSLSVYRFHYDGGKSIRPNVVIRKNGKIVSNNNYNDSYSVKQYTNNVYGGKANIKVTGRGICSGLTKDISFHIYYYPYQLSVSLSKTYLTYNGRTQKVGVTVKTPNGKIVPTNQYSVSGNSASAVGNHTVRLTFKQDFDGKTVTYPMSNGTVTKSFTIVAPKPVKKANPLKVNAKKVKLKFKMLRLGSMTVAPGKAFKVTNAQGSVSYKKVKGNKKISVNSMGIITVKKGIRKGTYKVKVRVTASGNSGYKAKSKTVKVKIVVR